MILIGYVIGFAITIFVLCVRDNMTWIKDLEDMEKYKSMLDDYKPTEFSCGNVKWDGYQLDINKGEMK